MNNHNSPIEQALQLLQPKWSLEILYQSFQGCRRFDQFQQQLGIARNLLSQRLSALTEQNLLKKMPVKQNSKRLEYRITEKGQALLPVLISLHQWSVRWHAQQNGQVKLIDQHSQTEIAPLLPTNMHGGLVDFQQIRLVQFPTDS